MYRRFNEGSSKVHRRFNEGLSKVYQRFIEGLKTKKDFVNMSKVHLLKEYLVLIKSIATLLDNPGK